METISRDLKYGLRMLWKNPGYTLIAVLTLALGIGANTAVFSVVNALLLRPLPYPNFERIAYVWSSNERASEEASLSPHNFTDLRTRSQSFDGYFAFRYTSYALTGDGMPESLNAVVASADFGRVMGVAPAQGRVFTAEDDVPGKNRVVLISYGLWQRRFAGKPIVGETIQLNGEAHTVIGVMPQQFAFPNPGIEVWAPIALDLSKYQRGTSFLQSVARLKPGVTVPQAQAESLSIAQQLARENTFRDFGFKVEPLREQMMGKIEKPLWILFGAVMLVLLIACVNVASLLLGRATVRWKEISVRAALGASRWNLIRLLLTESLLLGLLGGLFGLLLAAFGIEWLVKINPDALLSPKTISIDRFVVAFTMLASIITGAVFGMIPAWQMTKTNLSQAMRDTSRSTSGAGRLKLIRSGLVVFEIGLSLVLLVSSGLLLKSFWKLLQVNPGFRAENVVSCQISLPRAKYADEWQQAEFFRRAVESVRALPGVETAAAVTNVPFGNGRGSTSFEIDGHPTPPNTDGPVADNHEISPDYFRAMGIGVKAGRDFTEADDRTRPGVAIINERAAQLYWPGENPIGKRLNMDTPEETKLYGKGVWREIVGVIGNVKLLELNADFRPEIYTPMSQTPSANMALVVRGKASSESLINSIRQAVSGVDPNQPIRRAQLIETAISRSVAPQRFIAVLLAIFAGLAIILAMVGIYGVMSYAVAQRTQEIGVRMALGAGRMDVLRMILGDGMRLAGAGVALGLVGSLLITKVLASLLYGVSSTDVNTFAVVSLLLIAVALIACYFPARRATKVDPMVALRYE